MSSTYANILLFQATLDLSIKKKKFYILIKYTWSYNNAFAFESHKK